MSEQQMSYSENFSKTAGNKQKYENWT